MFMQNHKRCALRVRLLRQTVALRDDFDPTRNIPVIDLSDNAQHAKAARFHIISLSSMNGANCARVISSRRRLSSVALRHRQCVGLIRMSALEFQGDRKIYRNLARRIAEPPGAPTCNRKTPSNRW